MIQYIKQYAEQVMQEAKPATSTTSTKRNESESGRILSTDSALLQIHKEIDRLDPRDFEPLAQAEFILIRGNIDHLFQHQEYPPDTVRKHLRDLIAVLDHYRGEGTRGIKRQFPFIADVDLLAIIERDYAELSLKLFPSGAWKSTVIMAGSILEAVLFDRLASTAWNTKALASSQVPKSKGTPLPLEDWKLFHLIEVSVEIALLPKETADTIHEVLREYRNLVHPMKEKREKYLCSEAEGMLSVGALDSVCNYLEKNP